MERSSFKTCCRRSARRGSHLARAVLALASASLISDPVAAHSGTGLSGGWANGFTHPLSGIDHLLAMIAVGLWGAFLGRPLIYVLPVIFPTMMVVGAVLGMLAVPLPPVEIGIALSVLMLGSCIALAIRLPIWAACPIVALFAIFHGDAHGKELPSAADPVSYSAGFVLASGLLHVSGIALGSLTARPIGALATRSVGGLIAIGGAWFLLRAIAT
jgi:urease accessory protein